MHFTPAWPDSNHCVYNVCSVCGPTTQISLADNYQTTRADTQFHLSQVAHSPINAEGRKEGLSIAAINIRQRTVTSGRGEPM
jgi:hypothetical protein